jgi:hypothetical protein
LGQAAFNEIAGKVIKTYKLCRHKHEQKKLTIIWLTEQNQTIITPASFYLLVWAVTIWSSGGLILLNPHPTFNSGAFNQVLCAIVIIPHVQGGTTRSECNLSLFSTFASLGWVDGVVD